LRDEWKRNQDEKERKYQERRRKQEEGDKEIKDMLEASRRNRVENSDCLIS
jgi:hypothetical protein